MCYIVYKRWYKIVFWVSFHKPLSVMSRALALYHPLRIPLSTRLSVQALSDLLMPMFINNLFAFVNVS